MLNLQQSSAQMTFPTSVSMNLMIRAFTPIHTKTLYLIKNNKLLTLYSLPYDIISAR